MIRRAKKTTSKYGNKKTVVDGITFDSKKEAARYQELKLMQKAGLIAGLGMHPSFDLWVNNQRVCRYVADFSYQENGKTVVEDVKGVKTPVYNLKKKLMKALHGIEIQEI